MKTKQLLKNTQTELKLIEQTIQNLKALMSLNENYVDTNVQTALHDLQAAQLEVEAFIDDLQNESEA